MLTTHMCLFCSDVLCVDVSSKLDPSPVQVPGEMALYRLHDMFCKLGLRYCLITRFGKVVGICTKKDIIRYVSQQVELHGHIRLHAW